MTTEDALSAEPPPPAQITLTDCLACSGCVTSAEAVLVSLQSHSEVLNALDSYPSLPLNFLQTSNGTSYDYASGENLTSKDGKVFVASVSPQVRASLAATYKVTEQRAGWMIEQLLRGPQGIKTGGSHGSSFAWVVDSNAMREVCLAMSAEEVFSSQSNSSNFPSLDTTSPISTPPVKAAILTSACPGWVCYVEKSHPHVIPHLSRLKSPQALAGTLLKTVLSKTLFIPPDRIFHLAIMPCFDKKLEASREELTSIHWGSNSMSSPPVRDVDCVITARELLMLAESRGISFPYLPQDPLPSSTHIPFPSSQLDAFLFPPRRHRRRRPQSPAAGTSGGYLHHVLLAQQSLHPSSRIVSSRGRNADIVDYKVLAADSDEVLFCAARYYGFHNIQNLVRKLQPPKKTRLRGGRRGGVIQRPAEQGLDYAYVEVMACPGGCTNGGGQIKVEDIGRLQGVNVNESGERMSPKEWLASVDEAYYSMSSSSSSSSSDPNSDIESDTDDTSASLSLNTLEKTNDDNDDDDKNTANSTLHSDSIPTILHHWSSLVNLPLQNLIYTSYRQVISDVGKTGSGSGSWSGTGIGDVDSVVHLAGKIDGGW